MKKYLLLLCCFPLFLIACTAEDNEGEELVITASYSNDIKPIMDAYCISCHSSPPVNGAPMQLTTAASVKEAILDRGLIERVEEGSMPEVGRLSAEEVQRIKNWKAGGYE